jgi:hypothetical protein
MGGGLFCFLIRNQPEFDCEKRIDALYWIKGMRWVSRKNKRLKLIHRHLGNRIIENRLAFPGPDNLTIFRERVYCMGIR